MSSPLCSLIILSVFLCSACDDGSSSNDRDAAGAVDSSSADLPATVKDGATSERATPDQAATDHATSKPDQIHLPPGGPKALPQPTKPCPKIVEGQVTFLGVTVRVWVGNQPVTKKGPLVFYWHGTGTNAMEAVFGLGQKNIDAIKAQGGMVAAPKGPTGLTGAQTGGVVWRAGDYALADEILACAIQQVGIDPIHIHSMGMSAGGLHTAQMSYTRSGYLASVTTFSGGLIPILPPPPSQDPANKLPAMIMHGGDNDTLGGFSFKASSERYLKDLTDRGQFAFICDHGNGHWLPPGGGDAAWRLFQDHPFGTSPSPYKAGLPSGIPTYCTKP
jgi:predicted esterase